MRQQGAQRGGLDRLVEQANPTLLGLFAHLGRAIRRHEGRRQIGAVIGAQPDDGGEAIEFVEVKIGDDHVGRRARRRDGDPRLRQAGGDDGAASPAGQQRVHALEDARVVVDGHDAQARQRRARGGQGARIERHDGRGRGDRRGDREHRAPSGDGAQPDRVIKHLADALDDGQAKADARRDAGVVRQALELAEHERLLVVGNALSHVQHLNFQRRAAAAAADQHAPAWRVFDGVGYEVLQHPAQQPPVGAHRQRAGREADRQALLARDGLELDA